MSVLIVLVNHDVLCTYNLPQSQEDPAIMEALRNSIRERVRKHAIKTGEKLEIRLQRCELTELKPSYGMTYTESLLEDIMGRVS